MQGMWLAGRLFKVKAVLSLDFLNACAHHADIGIEIHGLIGFMGEIPVAFPFEAR